jgi:ribosomal protein L17
MPNTANFRRLVAGSTGQRKSILRNLVSSLIIHESITTTLAKAKAVQPYAERVITLGKKFTGARDQRERATAYLYVPPLRTFHQNPILPLPGDSTSPIQTLLWMLSMIFLYRTALIQGLENNDAKII